MVSSINSSLSAALLTSLSGNSSNTSTSTDFGLSADLLLQIAQAKSGSLGGVNTPTASSTLGKTVTAPWADPKTQPKANALVTAALSGKAYFDASTKIFSTPGLTVDDRNLFALHAGINTLSALVDRYNAAGVTTSEQARLQAAFATGVRQLDNFLATAKFSALSVTRGAALTQATTTAAVGSTPHDYATGVIAAGDPSVSTGVFDGDIRFAIDGTNAQGDPAHIDIDLAGMNSTPRSLDNVVFYINSQLHQAGFESQFSTVKQSAKAADGSDQYALNVHTETGETLSFSTTDASPAVYLVGDNRLVKFQDGGTAPPPAPGPLSSVTGQAYDKALAQASAIGAVHASAVGADGSIYIVADVKSGLTNDPIKGAQDAALFKYDSAGNLAFQRTLGAANSAQGLAIAVGADGRVAVGGAVTGALGDGVKDTSQSDGFVTVFDAGGAQQFTQRTSSGGSDQVNALAFAADGTLYAAGQAGSAVGGQTSVGGQDAFLTAYDALGNVRSTTQYGTVGDDSAQALAVEDLGGGVQRVSVGGNENGKLVLRQFSDDGATISAGATRDLGALVNGNVVGLAVDNGSLYVAGNNGVGGLDVANVASAYGGGQDGFVAKIASDLSVNVADRVSYIGGTGDDEITGLAVHNNEVYVGGDSKAGFAGQTAISDRDGFIARLDNTGALALTRRFAEADKNFTAAGFAFDSVGSTALDLLGLPSGDINVADTDLLTARTSLRAGDQFGIAVNGRSAQTITIAADDTISSLIAKVQKTILSAGTATGNFAANAEGLKINAVKGATITLVAGTAGKNALTGLGLIEGTITAAPATATPSGTKLKQPPPSYGLGLASTLALDSKLDAKQASDQLGKALVMIQQAFTTLSAPPKPPAAGKVPAYLTAQLANYQAALARLTAGGG